jgi:hypothetical protein
VSCTNPPSGYTAFPANGWTYDGTTWRAQVPTVGFPTGNYTSYAINTQDQSHAAPVTFTLRAPNCYWSAIVIGGTQMPTSPACTIANVGGTYNDGTYNWTCICQ